MLYKRNNASSVSSSSSVGRGSVSSATVIVNNNGGGSNSNTQTCTIVLDKRASSSSSSSSRNTGGSRPPPVVKLQHRPSFAADLRLATGGGRGKLPFKPKPITSTVVRRPPLPPSKSKSQPPTPKLKYAVNDAATTAAAVSTIAIADNATRIVDIVESIAAVDDVAATVATANTGNNDLEGQLTTALANFDTSTLAAAAEAAVINATTTTTAVVDKPSTNKPPSPAVEPSSTPIEGATTTNDDADNPTIIAPNCNNDAAAADGNSKFKLFSSSNRPGTPTLMSQLPPPSQPLGRVVGSGGNGYISNTDYDLFFNDIGGPLDATDDRILYEQANIDFSLCNNIEEPLPRPHTPTIVDIGVDVPPIQSTITTTATTTPSNVEIIDNGGCISSYEAFVKSISLDDDEFLLLDNAVVDTTAAATAAITTTTTTTTFTDDNNTTPTKSTNTVTDAVSVPVSTTSELNIVDVGVASVDADNAAATVVTVTADNVTVPAVVVAAAAAAVVSTTSSPPKAPNASKNLAMIKSLAQPTSPVSRRYPPIAGKDLSLLRKQTDVSGDNSSSNNNSSDDDDITTACPIDIAITTIKKRKGSSESSSSGSDDSSSSSSDGGSSSATASSSDDDDDEQQRDGVDCNKTTQDTKKTTDDNDNDELALLNNAVVSAAIPPAAEKLTTTTATATSGNDRRRQRRRTLSKTAVEDVKRTLESGNSSDEEDVYHDNLLIYNNDETQQIVDDDDDSDNNRQYINQKLAEVGNNSHHRRRRYHHTDDETTDNSNDECSSVDDDSSDNDRDYYRMPTTRRKSTRDTTKMMASASVRSAIELVETENKNEPHASEFSSKDESKLKSKPLTAARFTPKAFNGALKALAFPDVGTNADVPQLVPKQKLMSGGDIGLMNDDTSSSDDEDYYGGDRRRQRQQQQRQRRRRSNSTKSQLIEYPKNLKLTAVREIVNELNKADVEKPSSDAAAAAATAVGPFSWSLAPSESGAALKTLSQSTTSMTHCMHFMATVNYCNDFNTGYSDLPVYPLVYGAVPTKYKDAAKHYLKQCQLDFTELMDTSTGKPRTARKTPAATTAATASSSRRLPANYAPLLDGDLELAVYAYWCLEANDLVKWRSDASRKTLKRSLALLWLNLNDVLTSRTKQYDDDVAKAAANGTVYDESKVEKRRVAELKYVVDLIRNFACFENGNYTVPADCLLIVKRYFYIIMYESSNTYRTFWCSFMKACEIHHFLCPWTKSMVIACMKQLRSTVVAEASVVKAADNDNTTAIAPLLSTNAVYTIFSYALKKKGRSDAVKHLQNACNTLLYTVARGIGLHMLNMGIVGDSAVLITSKHLAGYFRSTSAHMPLVSKPPNQMPHVAFPKIAKLIELTIRSNSSGQCVAPDPTKSIKFEPQAETLLTDYMRYILYAATAASVVLHDSCSTGGRLPYTNDAWCKILTKAIDTYIQTYLCSATRIDDAPITADDDIERMVRGNPQPMSFLEVEMRRANGTELPENSDEDDCYNNDVDGYYITDIVNCTEDEDTVDEFEVNVLIKDAVKFLNSDESQFPQYDNAEAAAAAVAASTAAAASGSKPRSKKLTKKKSSPPPSATAASSLSKPTSNNSVGGGDNVSENSSGTSNSSSSGGEGEGKRGRNGKLKSERIEVVPKIAAYLNESEKCLSSPSPSPPPEKRSRLSSTSSSVPPPPTAAAQSKPSLKRKPSTNNETTASSSKRARPAASAVDGSGDKRKRKTDDAAVAAADTAPAKKRRNRNTLSQDSIEKRYVPKRFTYINADYTRARCVLCEIKTCHTYIQLTDSVVIQVCRGCVYHMEVTEPITDGQVGQIVERLERGYVKPLAYRLYTMDDGSWVRKWIDEKFPTDTKSNYNQILKLDQRKIDLKQQNAKRRQRATSSKAVPSKTVVATSAAVAGPSSSHESNTVDPRRKSTKTPEFIDTTDNDDNDSNNDDDNDNDNDDKRRQLNERREHRRQAAQELDNAIASIPE